MNLRTDLRIQARALLLALAMAVAGAASLMAGHVFQESNEREERNALAQRSAMQARLARMAEEESEIRAGDALFQHLATRGMIGEENRIAWVEAIARIRAERRLYDIRWEISPRRPLETAQPSGNGEFHFMASTLRLSLPLLHAEDLIRFLNDLSASLPAYVRVRRCSLTRRPTASDGPEPRLDAECELDLVTFARQNGGKP